MKMFRKRNSLSNDMTDTGNTALLGRDDVNIQRITHVITQIPENITAVPPLMGDSSNPLIPATRQVNNNNNVYRHLKRTRSSLIALQNRFLKSS